MIGYGDYKKHYKLHAHDKCGVCAEKSGTKESLKKTARRYNRREVIRNLESWE